MTSVPDSSARRSERKRHLRDRPRAAIERWQRRKLRRAAHAAARAISRWRLPWVERKRRKALAATFETFRALAVRNEGGNFPGFSVLLNIGLYLLIAERDIQAVKIDALTHPDEWTRKLHARIILLTIYEWDADKVTGRQLKQAMNMMLISAELQSEAIECLRSLRHIQRKAKKEFAYIRNASIAHRDPDALVQYRAIHDLKVESVMLIAVEFFSAIQKFVQLQTKLLEAGNNLPSLVRQWSEVEKEREIARQALTLQS